MTEWSDARAVWRRVPGHVARWVAMWTRVLLTRQGRRDRDALGAAFRARVLADPHCIACHGSGVLTINYVEPQTTVRCSCTG